MVIKLSAINDYKIVNIPISDDYLIEAKTMTIDTRWRTKIIEFPTDFLGQLSASKAKGLIELRQPFIISVLQENSINAAMIYKRVTCITL